MQERVCGIKSWQISHVDHQKSDFNIEGSCNATIKVNLRLTMTASIFDRQGAGGSCCYLGASKRKGKAGV